MRHPLIPRRSTPWWQPGGGPIPRSSLQTLRRETGVNHDSFPGKRRYIAKSSYAPMTEFVLLAGVIGLLTLIWMGLDSDDDNGGGGLMQPVLQPVRVRERR